MREDLKIEKVYNSSTSTENERVMLVAMDDDVNLRDYALIDNTFDDEGDLSNIHPHFFRLPSQIVNKGDIIYIHTGEDPKKRRKITLIGEPQIYRYYCGSGNSFWNDDGDTARLYKLSLEDVKVVPPKEKPKSKTFNLKQ